MIVSLIKSLRPKQWYKNFLLFLGVIFSLNLFNFSLLLDAVFAFIIFCILSGSGYIINDILDMKKDRKHPVKRKRPIASGKLKISYAIIASFILIIISLYWAFTINLNFFNISVIFFFSNLIYSLWLKRIILVDILVISVNYIIRAVAGELAVNVPLSPWITLCALLLALFLASGKRRHELLLLGKKAKSHRKILSEYSEEMLGQLTSISASTIILSYSLYTFFTYNPWMMITIPVVIYTIFRYLFLVQSKNIGGEPEIIFKDKGMLISMAIWIILCILILY